MNIAFLLSPSFALLLLGAGAWSLPATASADTPAEEEVMAVTQAACDAIRTGDLPALERLLAPDFTLVGTDASVQPRAQTLAETRAGEPRYEAFYNHDMTAHVYGEAAATVQGVTTLKGTAAGRSFALDVRFTDTLIRSDGHWRIVVSHATRIPAKQP